MAGTACRGSAAMTPEFDVFFRRNTWLYALDPRVKAAFVVVAATIAFLWPHPWPALGVMAACLALLASAQMPAARVARFMSRAAAVSGRGVCADRTLHGRAGRKPPAIGAGAGDGQRRGARRAVGGAPAGIGPRLLRLAQHHRPGGHGARLRCVAVALRLGADAGVDAALPADPGRPLRAGQRSAAGAAGWTWRSRACGHGCAPIGRC